MLEVGTKAPDFTLLNHNDEKVKLKDYKGKWVVLYFYPKDNTPGCTNEACDFTDGLADFEKLEAAVFGVSPDSTQSHRNFIEKYSLKINLLSDTEKEVLKLYDAWGVKKNYGKEYEGVIRSTFIIDPNGKIAANWGNVKVRATSKNGEVKHADQVYKKLQELKG